MIALLGLATLAGPAPAALVQFRTPSGNIGCVGDTGPKVAYVRCDIRTHSWPTPTRPKSCPFDYGQGLTVSAKGRGQFVCAGDTALNPGPPLAYGRSRRIGTISCVSRTSGITCTNARGGGFSLSRERYRVS